MSKRPVFLSAIACFAAVALTAGQVSNAPTKKLSTSPRTAWGQPDLQGIWDNHSITPLERPAQFAGREFLTPQEAAQLERKAIRSSSTQRISVIRQTSKVPPAACT